MYLIDKATNKIKEISRKTFSELGFRERAHLQEWLADNPAALGEKLLIIQKEFCGFDDTNERLDLLALDKKGNVVIIENKLDDTGRDVTWQALKYASYCSTLSADQIADIYQDYLTHESPGSDARKQLDDFFELGYDEANINSQQRIILVAANFRKEVTSTVIWLSRFNIRVNCFKATPYQHEDLLLLKLDQIIPVKEAEDYVIRMAEKEQEEIIRREDSSRRHTLRREFWGILLDKIKGRTSVFQKNSPTKDNILYAGGLMTYVSYVFTITKSHSIAGLKMYREVKDENKFIFDSIAQHKIKIEEELGVALEWDRANENLQSAISLKIPDVNYFDRDRWDELAEKMVDAMVKFESVMRKYLVETQKSLGIYLTQKEVAPADN